MSKEQAEVEEHEGDEGQLLEEGSKVTVTFAEKGKTILAKELNRRDEEKNERTNNANLFDRHAGEKNDHQPFREMNGRVIVQQGIEVKE